MRQSGFSTLEVLVAIVVMTVLFLASLTISEYITKKQFEGEFISNVILVKNGIINVLNNSEAWNATLNGNSNMACLLNTPFDCSSATGGEINLYDANGSPTVSRTRYWAHLSGTTMHWLCSNRISGNRKLPDAFASGLEASLPGNRGLPQPASSTEWNF